MAQRQRNAGFELVAVGVVYLTMCSAAFGQELGSLEWFEKEWKAASKWNVPAFTFFEYDSTGHRYVTANEVRALAALVKDKPEHPKRQEYEQSLTAFNNPNPERRSRIWFGKDGYRRSLDWQLKGETPRSLDEVSRRRIAWYLHEQTLSISDPRSAPPGRDFDSQLASAESDARHFVLRGMGNSAKVKFRIVSSRVDDQGRWHGRTESIDGSLEQEWSGVVDNEQGAVLVESNVVRRAEGREYLLGVRWEYSDWEYSDFFKKPIAHKAVRIMGDGRPFATKELVSFSKFDPSTFKELTRLPVDDVPDVVRGPLSYVNIFDTRPNVQEMTTTAPDGTVRVRSLAAPKENTKSWRGRIIGVLVASIVIGVVWIIHCRRR